MDSNVAVATQRLQRPPKHSSEKSSEKMTHSTQQTNTNSIPSTTTTTETTTGQQKNGSGQSADTSSDESDIEDDLVTQIHYNTVSSLAALKDMLQEENGDDDDEIDETNSNFIKHYFLKHVNALPSRNLCSPFERRRLSECREEDEEEESKDQTTNLPPTPGNSAATTSGSEKSLSDTSSITSSSKQFCEPVKVTERVLTGPNKHKFTVTKTQTQTQIAQALRRRPYNQAYTVHFPTTSDPRPSVQGIFNRGSPLPSPHLDKRFFDRSMIEMKSEASSTSTLDETSMELDEVWIKRSAPAMIKKQVSAN